jgi:hypothetical protein
MGFDSDVELLTAENGDRPEQETELPPDCSLNQS